MKLPRKLSFVILKDYMDQDQGNIKTVKILVNIVSLP